MSQTIRLGISTCPNDTFAFHALINRLVDWRGLEFKVELLDIQQLNEGLFAGDFDVAKTSFYAALRLADRYVVLPSGSALGFGVGPLLLSARDGEVPRTDSQQTQPQRTLCPGSHTTASLLFDLFYPETTQIEHVVFSDIMPRLKRCEADFGVCIHEGRFTWQNEDLFLVEDLGKRWESETGCPLPLGGLVAAKSLPHETVAIVQSIVLDSLQHALATPSDAMPTMRRYAQEFDDDVLMKHVDLYVNQWTIELGDEGRRALQELSRRAAKTGVADQLTIFEPA